ncbi:SIR2 family protein [Fusobacterium russii]|uniref:SIR2 family protein n=1 Tax=Fusobacterium russii TaxID=854 RepID=UPI0003A53F8D|nr:SIR2 family protein [Fusobacterium russii]
MADLFSKNDFNKFNIFLGEFLNKITNSPTTQAISRELFSIKKKDYILLNSNISLPELAQNLLDDVVLEKSEIIKILSKLFSDNTKYNITFHKNLLDSNLFSSIFSSSYDYIIEDYFFDLVNKNTPFCVNNDELKKISFYKIYGDLKESEKFVLSTQDIKRIKVLAFYETFWKKICADLCKNPTILLGINFNDSAFLGILDFIFSKVKNLHKPVFIYTDNNIKTENMEYFIKKYSMEVIEGQQNDFFNIIKEHFPAIKTAGDAPLQGYA